MVVHHVHQGKHERKRFQRLLVLQAVRVHKDDYYGYELHHRIIIPLNEAHHCFS